VGTQKKTPAGVMRTEAEIRELAYNLWWSWHPAAQQIFQELSPYVWEESNHNPVEVLQWVAPQELRARLQVPQFHRSVQFVLDDFHAYMGAKRTWMRSMHLRSQANPLHISARNSVFMKVSAFIPAGSVFLPATMRSRPVIWGSPCAA